MRLTRGRLGADHLASRVPYMTQAWISEKTQTPAGNLDDGAAFHSFPTWIVTMSMLGLGTALVYPTLLAAIGDAVPVIERASALGVCRFWRDSGFIAEALLAGTFADLFGFGVAIQIVAALTVASGGVAIVTVRGNGRSRLMDEAPAKRGRL